MKYTTRFAIMVGMLLLFWGCDVEFKSYKDMSEREQEQVYSIMRTDGPAGLSYDQFNTLSEPH